MTNIVGYQRWWLLKGHTKPSTLSIKVSLWVIKRHRMRTLISNIKHTKHKSTIYPKKRLLICFTKENNTSAVFQVLDTTNNEGIGKQKEHYSVRISQGVRVSMYFCVSVPMCLFRGYVWVWLRNLIVLFVTLTRFSFCSLFAIYMKGNVKVIWYKNNHQLRRFCIILIM